jgi:hypothetical protein
MTFTVTSNQYILGVMILKTNRNTQAMERNTVPLFMIQIVGKTRKQMKMINQLL